MTKYNKFLAALGTAVARFGEALLDGNVTPNEWQETILLLVAAALVWLIPNKPDTETEV